MLLQQCYGAYLREVKRRAIPRGPSEQRGLWVAPLWRPVYASACRWGATQAAGLPGLGSLTNPFYQLTQDPTPCWVLFYTVLIWRNRPSAIQNTLQTQHNTYPCLHTHTHTHTHTLTATRHADTTVACWRICTLWKKKDFFKCSQNINQDSWLVVSQKACSRAAKRLNRIQNKSFGLHTINRSAALDCLNRTCDRLGKRQDDFSQ